MNVVVCNIYAFKIDEDGNLVELTFGDEAYETVGRTHYYGLYE